ncbi:FCD domain-containing protein [Entomospira entomophila]|uniref:FadR family transcriptional regulator n=1 Tax=Entomospira entomophila TaxID=2719988 RepID=A0A968GAC4_9SPIO|nr:FCD domain-containing protein [Entomospira entomophilus]NIZ40720.1 FadR family transcriptional regulator [Entomospira entomophilus]WDI34933.1 FCD domain-containing protein [Entomospira entomophilus]
MFKAIEMPSVSKLIYEQMIELIKKKLLTPADRLPTAEQMANELGVAKTQVKLALTRLEHFGIITIKPQSGAYLANYSAEILIKLLENQLDDVDIKDQDLAQIRHQLEEHAVTLLLDQADRSYLAQLKAIHQTFKEKVLAGDRAVDEDFYFHFMIVKLANNSALSAVYSYLAPAVINFFYALEEKGYEKVHQRAEATIAEHQAILDALENQDMALATQAMRRHLTLAHQVL